MKALKILLGIALAGSFMQVGAFAQQPAQVQKEDRKEVRTDRRDVRTDRKDAAKAGPGKQSVKARQSARKTRKETRSDRQGLRHDRRSAK
jgi:hypothetical protein